MDVWVYGWVYSSCSLDIYEVKMGEMALWCVKPKVKTFRLGARIDISSCSLDIYEVKMGENEGYWRNGAMEREGKGGV